MPIVDDITWRWLDRREPVGSAGRRSAAACRFSRPRLKAGRLGEEPRSSPPARSSHRRLGDRQPGRRRVRRIASGLGSLGLVARTFLVLTRCSQRSGSWATSYRRPSAQRRVALTTAARPGIVSGRRRGSGPSTSSRPAGRVRAGRRSQSGRGSPATSTRTSSRPAPGADRRRTRRPADRLATRCATSWPTSRRSARPCAIQLEIGGLVSAFEWLAERVQRRSRDRDHARGRRPPPDAAEAGPPADVSSAAFRVAVLALSNVAYHAPRPRLRPGPFRAPMRQLLIVDDGPGISDAALAAARDRGRRGLSDMAAEAAGCGATVELGPGPGEQGTAVSFW